MKLSYYEKGPKKGEINLDETLLFQFDSESVVEDLMTASKYAVLITTSNSFVVSFDSYTNLITIERK